MAPKPPTRNPKASSSLSSSSTPKKPSKRKFTPKTHTTAGVALGKSKKAKKDPKKKHAALLQRLEKELPKLNMITPAGVVKPKGKKKGKVFVEDREKMMGILNRVNDDKDGRIQSKLERSRQLEAIREEKRKEEEARMEERKSKMQGAKDAVRRKRKRGAGEGQTEDTSKPRIKKVTFA